VKTIAIQPVASKRDLKAFYKFPWTIYRGDPNWVPPLWADFKDKLDRAHNPFFQHAEVELFMAFENGVPKGRVAAIWDRRYNEFQETKLVFFGLFECVDDPEVARALLARVEAWGAERGMEALCGPANLSLNDEPAFLLEGFDSPPVIMMSYNPPYYLKLMEECGLVKAKDLYAFLMTRDHGVKAKVAQVVDKIRRSTDVTLRPVNLKKIEEEAQKIKEVYNLSWEKNWGFVPWTDEEMEHLAKKLKTLADPNIIIMAEEGDKPIGFAFGLPNFNEVIQKINGRLTPVGIAKFLYYRRRIKGMRAVVFGILPEYRMSGISYLLFSELDRNAIAKGYQWCETSWQLEDNDAINRFVESIGGEIYKKYRIYQKQFANSEGKG
jgi:hypothetical protein